MASASIIYPFQHFYRRVKIDESKGERWFCTNKKRVMLAGGVPCGSALAKSTDRLGTKSDLRR